MHWNIQIGGKTIEVQLPDGVPSTGTFRIVAKGTSYVASFDRSQQALILQNSATITLKQHFSLRRMHVLKLDGESERQVNLEFSGGGLPQSISLRAAAHPFVPGIKTADKHTTHKAQTIRSPMAGKVLKIFVAVGANVVAGEALLIVEAMKMENKVLALAAGKVTTIKVKEGAAVTVGQELVKIE